MVGLPLFVEPSTLVWSRTVGGVTPTPMSNSLLWYAQTWAVRVPESTNNTTPHRRGRSGSYGGAATVGVQPVEVAVRACRPGSGPMATRYDL